MLLVMNLGNLLTTVECIRLYENLMLAMAVMILGS